MTQASLWLVGALIVVLNGARFVGLDVVPPGFEADEASNVTHIVCLRETGADANGVRFPLFSDQYGSEVVTGVVPPTNLYVGLVWESIFGHSIVSIRALSAFLLTMMTLGIYLLARLFVPREAALLCALAASVSPWAFQLSRLSGQVSFEPPLLVFWTYFFLRSNRLRDAATSGVFLALLLYSYPPARVQAPLVFVALLGLKHHRGTLAPAFVGVSLGVAFLGAVPLLAYMVGAGGQERVDQVTIFGRDYRDRIGGGAWPALVRAFLDNFLLHFNPDYLFFRGDRNLRHSTQVVGQWSWLDMAALLAGGVLLIVGIARRSWRVRRPEAAPPTAPLGPEGAPRDARPLLLFAVVGYLSGVVPAALTWEGIPHSLRQAGSLPFLALFTGLVLWRVSRVQRGTVLAAGVISVLFAGYFAFHYVRTYPTLARDAWFAPVREAAEQGGRTGNWTTFIRRSPTFRAVGQRYFLIEYGGEDCLSSERRARRLRQRS